VTRREEIAATTIAPGSRPGGFLTHLYVDGVMVRRWPLDDLTDLDALATAQERLIAGHDEWEILVYDGDTGELAVRIGGRPLDDFSQRIEDVL
jgi:hypothetical protein